MTDRLIYWLRASWAINISHEQSRKFLIWRSAYGGLLDCHCRKILNINDSSSTGSGVGSGGGANLSVSVSSVGWCVRVLCAGW